MSGLLDDAGPGLSLSIGGTWLVLLRYVARTELLKPSILGWEFVGIGDYGRPPTAPMTLASSTPSTSVWAVAVTDTGLSAAGVSAVEFATFGTN